MKYPHDCKRCTSLGTFETGGVEYDLYFCNNGSWESPTVIARYGSEPNEYMSGLGHTEPALKEALVRAVRFIEELKFQMLLSRPLEPFPFQSRDTRKEQVIREYLKH
jgi:hypothetical protein